MKQLDSIDRKVTTKMTRDLTITQNSSGEEGSTDEARDPESEISKKTFVGTVGVALTVLSLVLMVTVSMNAVTAAFSPGIGGINATFNTLNYNDTTAGPGHAQAHIYPTTNPSTAACPGATADANNGQVPVLTTDVPGTVSVKGLFLNKTIPVENAAGAPFTVVTGIDNITISIQAAQNNAINLDNPTLEFSKLTADNLNLSGGVRIYEEYSNGTDSAPRLGPEGEFHVNATNLEVDQASAAAHLIAFQSISLPNQTLELLFNQPNPSAGDSCAI
jgi:hypothetical protein